MPPKLFLYLCRYVVTSRHVYNVYSLSSKVKVKGRRGAFLAPSLPLPHRVSIRASGTVYSLWRKRHVIYSMS